MGRNHKKKINTTDLWTEEEVACLKECTDICVKKLKEERESSQPSLTPKFQAEKFRRDLYRMFSEKNPETDKTPKQIRRKYYAIKPKGFVIYAHEKWSVEEKEKLQESMKEVANEEGGAVLF